MTAEDPLSSKPAPPQPPAQDDFLRQVCAATRVGLWRYDCAADSVFWTSDPDVISRVTRDDAGDIAAAHRFLLHPDDRSAICARTDTCRCDGLRQVQFEHRILHVGGSVRWLEVRAELECDSAGVPVRLHGVAMDITERKRGENALRRVLEISTYVGPRFFQALVRVLAEALEVRCAYVCTLMEGRPYRARTMAVWFNGALAAGWEYSLEGTPCERVIEREIPIFIPAHLRSLFPNNTHIAKMGYQGYAGIPLIGSAGKPIGHLVVVHDGPMDARLQPDLVMKVVADRVASELERSQAEISARQSQLQFNNLIANTPNVAVQTLDAAGRVLSWNQASVALYGYTPAEVIGRPFTELPSRPEEAATFREAFDRATAGCQSSGPRECLIQRKDGSAAWCLSTVFAIHAAGDAPIVARMDIDITERVQLETRLQQAQKLDSIGRLAGGIAHDFNNLLTSIIGHTELARRSLAEAPERRHLDVIALAARQGAELTGQLLAFARRQPIMPRNVSLNLALADADRLLRRLLGEPIELCVIPDPSEPVARVDPGQLTQIIINLALNARDAMPRGGRLTLQSGCVAQAELPAGLDPDRYATLTVTDTGEGISEEHRRQLFEPFFTTKAAGHGTGLGLATCYGIVKQHKGLLTVESEVGRGATFRLYLPAGDRTDLPCEKQPVAGESRCRETIFVCEDEPLLCDLATEILSREGYQVVAARAGRDLLQLHSAHAQKPVDLLLTDLVMGDMSGPELAQEMKKLRPNLRVLYVSGYTEMTAFQSRPLDPGARFLQKPFSIADLTRTVREMLDAH